MLTTSYNSKQLGIRTARPRPEPKSTKRRKMSAETSARRQTRSLVVCREYLRPTLSIHGDAGCENRHVVCFKLSETQWPSSDKEPRPRQKSQRQCCLRVFWHVEVFSLPRKWNVVAAIPGTFLQCTLQQGPFLATCCLQQFLKLFSKTFGETLSTT